MKLESENCKQILALLSDYLNFELPANACAEIEDHLAGCTPCEEFAESLRKTVELCRKYEPSAMPGPLTDKARHELMEAWEKMRRSKSEL
jgi:RNA polymerase sigma-70 factor (ECF subfamily)